MSVSNANAKNKVAPPLGRRSRRRARRWTSAETSISRNDALSSGTIIGNGGGKHGNNYNRYAALSSTEEAPGAQNEKKRPLVVRRSTLRLLMSSVTFNSNVPDDGTETIKPEEEENKVKQPGPTKKSPKLLLNLKKITLFESPEAVAPKSMDVIKQKITLTDSVVEPSQSSQSIVTNPLATLSSSLGKHLLPAAITTDSVSSSELHQTDPKKDQTGGLSPSLSQKPKTLQNPNTPPSFPHSITGLSDEKTEVLAPITQNIQHQDHEQPPPTEVSDLILPFATAPTTHPVSDVKPLSPPTTTTTLTALPSQSSSNLNPNPNPNPNPTDQVRGWPSPTYSPLAPSTKNRQSRFFPSKTKTTTKTKTKNSLLTTLIGLPERNSSLRPAGYHPICAPPLASASGSSSDSPPDSGGAPSSQQTQSQTQPLKPHPTKKKSPPPPPILISRSSRYFPRLFLVKRGVISPSPSMDPSPTARADSKTDSKAGSKGRADSRADSKDMQTSQIRSSHLERGESVEMGGGEERLGRDGDGEREREREKEVEEGWMWVPMG